MINTRPKINPSDRFNESEASTLLGISRRTLARWRQSGKARPIPYSGLRSGRIYYKGSELIRIWIDG